MSQTQNLPDSNRICRDSIRFDSIGALEYTRPACTGASSTSSESVCKASAAKIIYTSNRAYHQGKLVIHPFMLMAAKQQITAMNKKRPVATNTTEGAAPGVSAGRLYL